jgi:hypothetical protein
MRKRRYAKYPSCFGSLDILHLCYVAQDNGMAVVAAYKPNMHCYNEISLFGTSEAMAKTEAAWAAAGNELKPRGERNLVFGVNKSLPRDKWIDSAIRTNRAAFP